MKRFGIFTIAVMFLFGSVLYAADINSVKVAKAEVDESNIIIPIELTNTVPMAALDLPLTFSEGVTLQEVIFEGTDSEDFDFRYANIDNANRTVIIGLIPMVYGEKADLEVGNHVIAMLKFSVDNQNVEGIEINTTTTDKPSHDLMLVYTEEVNGGHETRHLVPEFNPVNADIPPSIDPMVPERFELCQNSPNPFNPITRIDYSLPVATHVRLNVYNVLGQNVRTLVDEFQGADYHSVIWDGCNNDGASVASGVYFYRIDAGEMSVTKKMMMLK
jgi:hypothetical protein